MILVQYSFYNGPTLCTRTREHEDRITFTDAMYMAKCELGREGIDTAKLYGVSMTRIVKCEKCGANANIYHYGNGHDNEPAGWSFDWVGDTLISVCPACAQVLDEEYYAKLP